MGYKNLPPFFTLFLGFLGVFAVVKTPLFLKSYHHQTAANTIHPITLTNQTDNQVTNVTDG